MLDTLEPRHVEHYERWGYCVIDELLSPAEIEEWRGAVEEAVAVQLAWSPSEREAMRRDHACFHNQPSPGEEPGRSSEIFLQCVNLWKTTERMRRLVLSPALGKLAAEAAQCDGIHLYHDHVLTKRPGADATNWHLDNGSDPFTSPQQVMMWLALDGK